MVEIKIEAKLRDQEHCVGCPCAVINHYKQNTWCNFYQEYLTVGASGPIRLQDCKSSVCGITVSEIVK